MKNIKHKKPLLPDLYILGVQKAGTTSLHAWLSQHPEIYSNDYIKDVDFFTHPIRSTDPVKYLGEFISDYNNERIFLQTHVNYIFYEKALKRIREVHKKHPKFILVLRNPVDRAVSAYHYFVKVNREKRDPEKALIYQPVERQEFSHNNNDLTYIEHGFYFKQLQTFEKYFSLNDLLILDFKQLVYHPEKIVKQVFEFIGVEEDFIPSFNVRNTTGTARFKLLHRIIYGKGNLKRKLIWLLTPIYNPQKRKILKERINELNTKRTKNKLEVDKKVNDKLLEIYTDDIQNLKQVYQLEFVNDWLTAKNENQK